MLIEILIVITLLLQITILHEAGHAIVAGKLFIGFNNSIWKMHPMAFINKMTVEHFLLYVMAGLVFSLPIAILSGFLLGFPYRLAVQLFWFLAAINDIYILCIGSVYIWSKEIDLREKIEDIEPGLQREF